MFYTACVYISITELQHWNVTSNVFYDINMAGLQQKHLYDKGHHGEVLVDLSQVRLG